MLLLYTVMNSCDIAGSDLPPLLPGASQSAIHTLRILQPVLSPLRLQVTPVLAEVKASLILSISEQSRIAQLCASVCLGPESYGDGVAALVVDYAWRKGESCLRPDLRNEFAICEGREEVSHECNVKGWRDLHW